MSARTSNSGLTRKVKSVLRAAGFTEKAKHRAQHDHRGNVVQSSGGTGFEVKSVYDFSKREVIVRHAPRGMSGSSPSEAQRAKATAEVEAVRQALLDAGYRVTDGPIRSSFYVTDEEA